MDRRAGEVGGIPAGGWVAILAFIGVLGGVLFAAPLTALEAVAERALKRRPT